MNKSKSEKKKDFQRRSQRLVRSQQYVYVTYMEENPDFVQNETVEHWSKLARRLNEANGPKKSPQEWKTTFMRWKHQVAYRARQAATGQSKLYKNLTQIDVRALIALGKDIPRNCHIIGETDPTELIEKHAKRKSEMKIEEEVELPAENTTTMIEVEEIMRDDGDDEKVYTLEVHEEGEDEEDVEEEEEIPEPEQKHFHEPPRKTYQAQKRKPPAAESARMGGSLPASHKLSSRATSPDSPEFIVQPRQVDDREFQLKKRKVLALERRAMAQERIADAFDRIVNVLESRFERDLPDVL